MSWWSSLVEWVRGVAVRVQLGSTRAMPGVPARTYSPRPSDFTVALSASPSSSVSSGSTVTLSTTVTGGTAAFTYAWYAAGVVIGGATSSSYTTPALSATTTTGSALLSQSGANLLDQRGSDLLDQAGRDTDADYTYSVRVTDSTGLVTTASIDIDVVATSAPPTITTQPTSSTITSGSAGSATIVIAGGSAPYDYELFAGTSGSEDTLVDSDYDLTATSDTLSTGTLTVTASTVYSYWVKVTDAAGKSVNSDTFTVTVTVTATGYAAQESIVDGTGRGMCAAYDPADGSVYVGGDVYMVKKSKTTDRYGLLQAQHAGLNMNTSSAWDNQHKKILGLWHVGSTLLAVGGANNGGAIKRWDKTNSKWYTISQNFYTDASTGATNPRPAGQLIAINSAETYAWVSCQSSANSNKYGLARVDLSAETVSAWLNFASNRFYSSVWVTPSSQTTLYAAANTRHGAAATGGVWIIRSATGAGTEVRIDNAGTNNPGGLAYVTFLCPVNMGTDAAPDEYLLVGADADDGANAGVWLVKVGDPTTGTPGSGGYITWYDVTPSGFASTATVATNQRASAGVCRRSGTRIEACFATFIDNDPNVSASDTYRHSVNTDTYKQSVFRVFIDTPVVAATVRANWQVVSGKANVSGPAAPRPGTTTPTLDHVEVYGTGATPEKWFQTWIGYKSAEQSRLGGSSFSAQHMVHVPNTGHVIVVGKGGAWICENPWATTPRWQPFVRGLGAIDMQSVACHPTDPLKWCAPDIDRVYMSGDNGGYGQVRNVAANIGMSTSIEGYVVSWRADGAQTSYSGHGSGKRSRHSSPGTSSETQVTETIVTGLNVIGVWGHTGATEIAVLAGASGNRGIYRRSAAGVWTRVQAITITGSSPCSGVVIPGQAAMWITIPGSGLWRSTDSGNTWANIWPYATSGVGELFHGRVAPSSANPGTVIYVAWDDGAVWKVSNAHTATAGSSGATVSATKPSGASSWHGGDLGLSDIVSGLASAVVPGGNATIVAAVVPMGNQAKATTTKAKLVYRGEGESGWTSITDSVWQQVGQTCNYLSAAFDADGKLRVYGACDGNAIVIGQGPAETY